MIVGFVGSGSMAAAIARGWAGEFEGMLFSDSGSGRAAELAREQQWQNAAIQRQQQWQAQRQQLQAQWQAQQAQRQAQWQQHQQPFVVRHGDFHHR